MSETWTEQTNTSTIARTDQRTIRVVVVEDQPDIREGLKMLIDATPGYRCIGSYGSMEDAIADIHRKLPDVVLSDIGLPGMSGIDGIRILKRRYPGLLLLMLSVYDDDDRIFDALCAGACGYLLKRTSSNRLLEGIKEAVTGGTSISPDVASRVLGLFRNTLPPERDDNELTTAQVKLLELLVEGHNYNTAADNLNMNTDKVRFQMRLIFDKMQAHYQSAPVHRMRNERSAR
ncbi:MAG TPA: response regulator transcription factor [Blastocatellia bacterium]|nr:response regulator transcription factor [Blastocatellia bacterium]